MSKHGPFSHRLRPASLAHRTRSASVRLEWRRRRRLALAQRRQFLDGLIEGGIAAAIARSGTTLAEVAEARLADRAFRAGWEAADLGRLDIAASLMIDQLLNALGRAQDSAPDRALLAQWQALRDDRRRREGSAEGPRPPRGRQKQAAAPGADEDAALAALIAQVEARLADVEAGFAPAGAEAGLAPAGAEAGLAPAGAEAGLGEPASDLREPESPARG